MESGAIGDDAELGAFWVGHDYDRPLVVLATLAGRAATERHDAGDCPVEVVGKQAEMDPGLALLGIGYMLGRRTQYVPTDKAGPGRYLTPGRSP